MSRETGLVRVAAKATDFEIAIPGIERVAQRRRRLRWSLVAEHAHVPRFAGELVGFLPRQLRLLGGKPDRMPVEIFAGLGAHRTRMRPADRKRQAATNCGGWRAGHNGGDAAPPVRCRCVSTGFGRSSSSKYPTAPYTFVSFRDPLRCPTFTYVQLSRCRDCLR